MSRPSDKSHKKKAKDGEKATELPDDEAILKLFPKRVVDNVNEEIEHKPAPKADDSDSST